jgi:hypothetical protein
MKSLSAMLGLALVIAASGCSDTNAEIRNTVQYEMASKIFEPTKYKLTLCQSEEVFTVGIKFDLKYFGETFANIESPEMARAIKLLFEDKCR